MRKTRRGTQHAILQRAAAVGGAFGLNTSRLRCRDSQEGATSLDIARDKATREVLRAARAALAPVPGGAPPAPAVRLRALVVGINAYANPIPGQLANPVGDARALHEALSALPGAACTLLTDCTKAALEAALVDFRDGTGVCAGRGMCVAAAAPSDSAPTLAVIFFAGHGIQVAGRNYIVPSDFKVPTQNKLEPMLDDIARSCVSLDLVDEGIERAAPAAAAVWLDCMCTVPDFLVSLGAKQSEGDASSGLRNVMKTFAAAPGCTVLDGSPHTPGRSPFAAALLAALAQQRRLFELVPFLTDEVCRYTNGMQRPYTCSSLDMTASNLLLGGGGICAQSAAPEAAARERAAGEAKAASERAAAEKAAREKAAAEQAAAAERAAAEARAAAADDAARRKERAEVNAAVPSDVAALLSQLSLSSHGPTLVDKLGVASVADLRLLQEGHLKEEIPEMRTAERLRLLNAVAKLGGASVRLSGPRRRPRRRRPPCAYARWWLASIHTSARSRRCPMRWPTRQPSTRR
jgi:hypothetical protein